MKKTIVILAVLASCAAFADKPEHPPHPPHPTPHQGGFVHNVTDSATASSSSSATSGAATAQGGTASATGGAAAGGEGGRGGAGGTALGGANTNTSTNQSSVVNERSAQSAWAPGLAVGNGTCMGSTSGAAQGVTFGLSLGTTWHDESCDRRYNAQMLDALGQAGAAVALMCQDPTVKQAMRDAGAVCPARPARQEDAAKQEYTDPYVRRRLGLPALE